jgi:hypothetical protein
MNAEPLYLPVMDRCFVSLVRLVYLVQPKKPNKRDKPDKPNHRIFSLATDHKRALPEGQDGIWVCVLSSLPLPDAFRIMADQLSFIWFVR